MDTKTLARAAASGLSDEGIAAISGLSIEALREQHGSLLASHRALSDHRVLSALLERAEQGDVVAGKTWWAITHGAESVGERQDNVIRIEQVLVDPRGPANSNSKMG